MAKVFIERLYNVKILKKMENETCYIKLILDNYDENDRFESDYLKIYNGTIRYNYMKKSFI